MAAKGDMEEVCWPADVKHWSGNLPRNHGTCILLILATYSVRGVEMYLRLVAISVEIGSPWSGDW